MAASAALILAFAGCGSSDDGKSDDYLDEKDSVISKFNEDYETVKNSVSATKSNT